jgi:hypothetical protein
MTKSTSHLRLFFLAGLTTAVALVGTARAVTADSILDAILDIRTKVDIGRRIAPVPLNLKGKDPTRVYLGSYILNAQGGCNDCHTNPSYAPGGDPFQGQPEKINSAPYLAGGKHFGPFTVSANLTPDGTGKPAGLTLREFITVLRTGHDPEDPDEILQVMPWPVYGKMSENDLKNVYEFLRAIPHAEPGP